jgi:hypothetical protein
MCSQAPRSTAWTLTLPTSYAASTTYTIRVVGTQQYRGLLLRASAGTFGAAPAGFKRRAMRHAVRHARLGGAEKSDRCVVSVDRAARVGHLGLVSRPRARLARRRLRLCWHFSQRLGGHFRTTRHAVANASSVACALACALARTHDLALTYSFADALPDTVADSFADSVANTVAYASAHAAAHATAHARASTDCRLPVPSIVQRCRAGATRGLDH